MRVTAIVVARGGSRRVPGKALRPFGSSTLIGHKVDQLRQCARIDDVVVGSDDEAILREAALHGADVRKRDDYHCDESQCSANEMIRNMVAMVETDVVVWAHPTNPLVLPGMYDQAVDGYLSASAAGTNDSLFSGYFIQRHAWKVERLGGTQCAIEPANFNPWGERHQLASELEPLFYQDGAIFIQPHRQMLDNAYFYGKRPLLYEIGGPCSVDIDTEEDLHVARGIYAAMRREVTA